ncbi:hypothetical protein VPH35_060717 [Triticum aestivum]
MQTEQDPMMELSMVSMDLTLLHCPLCLRPLKPPVYECKGGYLPWADCRVERPGNQRQCQKCKHGGDFDVRNMAVDAILSSVRVECPHEVAKLWANGPPGEPKGRAGAVKVEMEVTSSKDPGDVALQELTFFIVPPKLLSGAKLVSLHIQIDKLTS